MKFSDFSYIPKAHPLGLKPGFYTNCLSPQAHCMNECFFLYQTKPLFWPTFSCQILIKFSFLESLWHKETDCTSFAKNFFQIICKQPVKGNLHIDIYFNYTSGYLKFCKHFWIVEMARSRAFKKCIFYHFLDILFANIFCNITGFCDKKFNFCKFANFYADSKSRAQELSNDVSFVIFGH